jgi:hypothetical protein
MNDDRYGTLLLRPLAVEPEGPSAVDVRRAMREGLRRRRRRWWYGGGLLTTLTVAVVTGNLLIAPAPHDDPKPPPPPDPPLPAACSAAKLPTGAYKSVEVTGGDSTGRWAFGLSNPVADTGVNRIVVWHDDKIVDEVSMPPKIQLTMYDINASGEIVGSGREFPSGRDYPYVYRDGEVTRLAGGIGEAKAINDDGVIIGDLGKGFETIAVRWLSPGAEPERLPMPPRGGHRSSAVDIAADGTIAGEVEYLDPDADPPTFDGPAGSRAQGGYLWLPDGRKQLLDPLPAAGDRWPVAFPIAFGFGWLYAWRTNSIASSAGGPPGARTPALYRYDLRSDTWQRLAGDRTDGQVVGPGRGGMKFLTSDVAIYAGSRVLRLPMSPVGGPPDDSAMVAGVADDLHTIVGSMVAGQADLSQPWRPVVWHCR